MSNRIDWLSQLKTTENEKTGHKRYYFKTCDIWQRVAKADYESRCEDANRTDSFLTQFKRDVIHQYKTVYGVYFSKNDNLVNH